jgi:hypothetical protein
MKIGFLNFLKFEKIENFLIRVSENFGIVEF